MNATEKVSFVIPHKGRLDMLARTIQSISDQEYPAEKIEIIVVSQTEEIRSIEKQYDRDEFEIKFALRPDSETISELRNYGVKLTTGDFLAFLDADIFLAPDWINTMFSELSIDNHRVLVSAMQACDSSAKPLEYIRTCLSNVVIDSNVKFLPGRNLFLARHIFDEAGGFPAHLITCEDYYFTDKVSNLGNLYYTSRTNYIHLGEDKNFNDMFKKEIWRGQSNIQSTRGRKIGLRELPSIVLPLAMAILVILSIVCLFLKLYYFSITLILMSLLPVFLYSFRLFYMSKYKLGIGLLLKFYTVYFIARMVGTLIGVIKPIKTEHK